MYNLDDVITFSHRHPNETIRQIIRYDSGYLKDLFLNDKRVVFSLECYEELKRLTLGHKDNWEAPKGPARNTLNSLKLYGKPYLYDFNDENLEKKNKERMK